MCKRDSSRHFAHSGPHVVKLARLGIRSTLVGVSKRQGRCDENSSPEAALTPGPWRRNFIRGAFHDSLKAVVIDEAHCITKWQYFVINAYVNTQDTCTCRLNYSTLQCSKLAIDHIIDKIYQKLCPSMPTYFEVD